MGCLAPLHRDDVDRLGGAEQCDRPKFRHGEPRARGRVLTRDDPAPFGESGDAARFVHAFAREVPTELGSAVSPARRCARSARTRAAADARPVVAGSRPRTQASPVTAIVGKPRAVAISPDASNRRVLLIPGSPSRVAAASWPEPAEANSCSIAVTSPGRPDQGFGRRHGMQGQRREGSVGRGECRRRGFIHRGASQFWPPCEQGGSSDQASGVAGSHAGGVGGSVGRQLQNVRSHPQPTSTVARAWPDPRIPRSPKRPFRAPDQRDRGPRVGAGGCHPDPNARRI